MSNNTRKVIIIKGRHEKGKREKKERSDRSN
jgi:hypothetical protein